MEDKPFTNSIQTDIVLLSTILNGEQEFDAWRNWKFEHKGNDLLEHITNLLNIGNTPNSVIVVVGITLANAVKCIVFSGSSGQQNELFPNCSLQSIRPDATKGAELLDNWDTGSDFMNTHLQDIFDVIGHLQSTPAFADFPKLIFFTQRRAFQKLGQWVKELTEHCGNTSPFDIVENCLDSILESSNHWTQSFQVRLGEMEYEVVKKFVNQDDAMAMEPGKYRYWVNEANFVNWIALFKYIWRLLQKELLETVHPPLISSTCRKVISTAPSKVSTQIITLLISCLYALRPIWKFMFSLPVPKLHQALLVAEHQLLLAKLSERRRPSFRLYKDADDQDPDEIYFAPSEDETSAERIICSLTKLTSQYSSAFSLWSQVPKFLHDKTLQVDQFSSGEAGPFDCCEDEVAAILQAVSSERPDAQAIHNLQNAARAATVHAEAALMGYAYHQPTDQIFTSAPRLPVGVSNKCCRLCWMLNEDMKRSGGNPDLIFPGTHSVFTPWIPPFGVPDRTLRSLRSKLIETVYRRIRKEPHFNGQIVYTGQVSSNVLRQIGLIPQYIPSF